MSTQPIEKKSSRKLWLGLLALLVIILTSAFLFTKNFYDQYFERVDAPEVSGYLRYSDLSGVDRSVVQFKSGENQLTGYIYGLENAKALVVIVHGQGESAETYLSETLNFISQGYRVFAYDMTGTFESEGKSVIGLPQALIDLDAALTFVKSNSALNKMPLLLYGHSWGGYAVSAILNKDYDISAVASISGFNSPMELVSEESHRMLGFLAPLAYPFEWTYQTLLFGSTASVKAIDGINRSQTPVMIIHGDGDESVSYTGASIIAHRQEITNPKVVYKTCSAKNHNGHNNLFESEAASQYIRAKNEEYKALSDQYGGDIPTDIRTAYYASVDRFQTSEMDADFMNDINRFFEDALTK